MVPTGREESSRKQSEEQRKDGLAKDGSANKNENDPFAILLRLTYILAPVERIENRHVLPHYSRVGIQNSATKPNLILLLTSDGRNIVAAPAESAEHYLVANDVELLLGLPLDVLLKGRT